MAATVYEDLTTAHDLFGFPVVEEEDKETNEPTKCNLHFKPQRIELLKQTRAIIWDDFRQIIETYLKLYMTQQTAFIL